MRRRWLNALLLPIWALWFALAITEPISLDNCPMQAQGSVAHSPAPMMTGMHHAMHPGQHHSTAARCCTLGDCGLSQLATMAKPAIAVACDVAIATTTPAFPPALALAHSHADFRLPFPNGPPQHPIA